MPGRSPLPPSHASRQLASALGDSSAGAALLSRLETSRRIGRILAHDPGLADCGVDFERPGLCELRDGTLRLAARSPAEKAKLRQSAPAMQRALAAHGFEGIEIKLTVQPCHVDYRIRVSNKNLGSEGPEGSTEQVSSLSELMAIRDCAEKLAHTSVHPMIRASAERMYRSAQTRLAGMRDDRAGKSRDRDSDNRS